MSVLGAVSFLFSVVFVRCSLAMSDARDAARLLDQDVRDRLDLATVTSLFV